MGIFVLLIIGRVKHWGWRLKAVWVRLLRTGCQRFFQRLHRPGLPSYISLPLQPLGWVVFLNQVQLSCGWRVPIGDAQNLVAHLLKETGSME